MENPFIGGNFAPLTQEHTSFELPVTGTIPEHLDGRYLRNGPNPISEIDPETYNWFMGDGMVHGVRLRDGRAQWYRNRWVRSPHVAAALGETAPRTRQQAGLEVLGANTNVMGHGGRTLALIEGGGATQELSDDLDTVGPCDFDGTLSGGYTAHPQRDPETGELHAVSYSFGRGNTVQYSVIGVDGRARRTVDIKVTGSPMMHNFSLTENHVVFYDLPVTFDTRRTAAATLPRGLRTPARLVLSAIVGKVRIPDPVTAMTGRLLRPNSVYPYSWDPTYPARIGVMPRTGGAADVRWFDVEQCYVFHPLNAYEDGDTIVLDLVRHQRMFDSELRGPNEGPPTLDRWIVNLTRGKVGAERLSDRSQEFPRIDERLQGRRHRFGYTQALADAPGSSNAVLKHDLVRGECTVRNFGAGREPGEFLFEPNAPDSPEDDGVLMGFVYNRDEDRSDLELLDAGSLETIAQVHLPSRVPNGFHGNWAPAT